MENKEYIKDPIKLQEKLIKMKSNKLKNFKNSFTYRISKWADVLPGAHINLWFDSALVTQKALQKTLEMMRGSTPFTRESISN